MRGEVLTHRTAWEFVLATAHGQRPDLLVLAGDIIDSDNQFLETWGPLREGVLGLLRAGISIAAIAGNHDAEVFPELHRFITAQADIPEGAQFHLLRGGNEARPELPEWTERRIRINGQPLTLVGWSFLQNNFMFNPMNNFKLETGERPVLGLLHGDLLSPTSRHAPLRAADLADAPVDQWVLGHIHIPTGADGKKYFYCGSPFPLRATEMGAHGCWMLECRDGRFDKPRLLPCPVRVDGLEVQLAADSLTDAALSASILTAIRARIREIQLGTPELHTLYLKLRLAGRCSPGDLLPAVAAGLSQLAEVDGVQVALLGAVENGCTAPVPLERWAEREDTHGRIARMLLSLERGTPDVEARQLIGKLMQEEAESRGLRNYLAVGDSMRDPETGSYAWAVAVLIRSCWRILDAIYAQEEAHA